ncbi:ATP-binding cassette domain-containing protein [Rossellomorea vietnamensis]|uniref:ATP-binding cassette domain-containing protein n=1 Tax=Rossellomorea vietnamensis TaxID=218284 RepID=A0A5D4M6S4_9BACI|nr:MULTISPECIES: ATP-binding cassette domain-containing protein [Bacillaceae]TYR97574.1 ATP-binding cassette domain-containing protein [Rossellomorea vietnamensis]
MSLLIENINKHYGTYHAVKNLSLSVNQGEAVGLLGRNGAGKTTTIRMILGLVQQESGNIQWEGKPLSRKEIKIGYLPEERGLYPKMNMLDQLIYFGRLEGMSKRLAKQEGLNWIERLGINEYIHKDTGELSKGNQQKVQLIAAVMHDPDLIILDEPFSGLDPVNAQLLEEVIGDLIYQKKTLIFSSHRMESVESFCDKVYLMKHGEVVLSGSLNEIKTRYGFKYVNIESPDLLEEQLKRLQTDFVKKGKEFQIRVKTMEQGLHLIERLKSMVVIQKIGIASPSLNQIFIEKAGDSS